MLNTGDRPRAVPADLRALAHRKGLFIERLGQQDGYVLRSQETHEFGLNTADGGPTFTAGQARIYLEAIPRR
jgi:hypothetical protein